MLINYKIALIFILL